MRTRRGCCCYFFYFIFFLPIFLFLFILGFIKAVVFSPFVFLVIAFGDVGIVIGLWPVHLIWSIICIKRMEHGATYGEHAPLCVILQIFPSIPTSPSWIRWLSGRERSQSISTPIMLVKGWHRLIQDLVGREGPFLETVCVPFAGLWILLWPFVVLLASFAGITSIIGFGCYAAVVAFQENSLKRGLLYVIASISLFDEYTNDLLYLREGSCFPRPKYREKMDSSSLLVPGKGLHEHLQAIHTREPLIMTTAEQKSAVKAVVIWDSFFKACVDIGKELIRDEAIGLADLEAWRHAKNKIVNVGIPSHVFLQCFLRSIKRGSVGFLMRDDVEITHVNRPEGRIFDWLYEPMSIMKEQIRRLNLQENEQLYLYKFCLYSGDTKRIESWENGGVPSPDEIRRAQLEGISRRLQGFCLTLSRLPTSRRRFFEVLGVLEQEAKNAGHIGNGYDIEAAT
ncbi:uncharacterized membrane protein At3g27390-like isoform X2 [Momordica charantia]|uniref:Uncharacterized membrane protein At3g27390-like isoform X2 n=1 Tax=Momordica charantia TaxID=3673 RepID=A0A6J1DYS4_MOMCH|nr:uncharacterized membrane protein At3g27390-like isoform X2 [Momordica charantia]